MNENVVLFGYRANPYIGEAFGDAGDHRRLKYVSQVVDELWRHDGVDRRSDHRLRRSGSEKGWRVGRDVLDCPSREAEGDQASKRLNHAEIVDRFLVAFVLLDLRLDALHAESSP